VLWFLAVVKPVQVSFKLHCTIFHSTGSHKLADVLSWNFGLLDCHIASQGIP
jgi:hypothetical protein